MRSLILAGAILLALPGRILHGDQAAYEGFGASTPGGRGKPVYRVTTLDDDGPGSLRDAVSRGNRTVVFAVAGDIVLRDHLWVRGAFITVDGLTAPPPGITLRNKGVVIRGNRGAHDVIIRGIRVRDADIDGFQIAFGTHRVVLDHVSAHGSADGNVDVTEDSHDVTVSWSIFAQPAGDEKNSLLASRATRLSLHHNLFVAARQRNPQYKFDDVKGAIDPGTSLDMRNNLIWGWRGGYGTLIWHGARANVVGNYYGADGGDAPDALIVCTPRAPDRECAGASGTTDAHISGNASQDGVRLNEHGSRPRPFPAPAVTTTDARTAACQIMQRAGVRPLDRVDQKYLATISIPDCRP